MNTEKHVYIIFSKYFDFDKKEFTLGGIQTYLHNLIPVFQELGYSCCVYGTGNSAFQEIEINGIKIVNIPTPKSKKVDSQVKMVLEEVEKIFCDEKDILLFATDCQIAKNKASKSIVIQHGITWDVPINEGMSIEKNNLFLFRKAPGLWKKIRKLSMAKQVVCVDYNYVNWYRASTAYEAVPMTVIPNFSNVFERCDKSDKKIKIIFARRLEKYRGSILFANVIKRILDEYEKIEVTIAGKGPAEKEMREILSPYFERVEFISYKSEDSFSVHADKHIAVIPTIGSEGTSLSLLEAMAANCAVVCTNVGGMTNIVIDGYNGLMISPNEDELYKAIKTLIENEELRKSFAEKGYDVVASAFTLERWREKWKNIITSTEKG